MKLPQGVVSARLIRNKLQDTVIKKNYNSQFYEYNVISFEISTQYLT